MRPIVFSFPAAVTTAICTAQTTAGSGALTIDGTLLDGPATMGGTRRVILPGIQRVVSLTSTGNLSAVNVTITGKNLRGDAVTETRTGPNNSTVETAAEFSEIDSVTVDAAVGTAMSVGTGSSGKTNWATMSGFANPANITVGMEMTGSAISGTVENTLDDAQTNGSPIVFTHPTINAVTSSIESNFTAPPRFVRGTFTGATTTGAATLVIIQSGF